MLCWGLFNGLIEALIEKAGQTDANSSSLNAHWTCEKGKPPEDSAVLENQDVGPQENKSWTTGRWTVNGGGRNKMWNEKKEFWEKKKEKLVYLCRHYHVMSRQEISRFSSLTLTLTAMHNVQKRVSWLQYYLSLPS